MYFPEGWFSFTTTNASVRFLGESETKERQTFQGEQRKMKAQRNVITQKMRTPWIFRMLLFLDDLKSKILGFRAVIFKW